MSQKPLTKFLSEYTFAAQSTNKKVSVMKAATKYHNASISRNSIYFRRGAPQDSPLPLSETLLHCTEALLLLLCTSYKDAFSYNVFDLVKSSVFS